MGTNIEDIEWQREQERVEYVIDQIEQRIAVIEEEVGSVRSDVVDMRKDFWDEVTMNFSESDDVGETSTSLRQQSEVLSDRERTHRQSFIALGKMKRLLHSPYFGRIDFAEDGEQPDAIYLGIASLLEKGDETFLVYDWRAPISNLYYDSTPGPATYTTPMGEISGTMSLKRQYVIRDRAIQLMFDTGVTIGDELLQQVLSRSSDAQMKSIVATIQKEQNRIIRNERSRMLIVQGSAGSGKTSAALQRVAYLLYKHREHLRADEMVLFSPNPMFNSYVSTVLPELGEENMKQTTFQEYLERRLGREFQLDDPFIQMENVLADEDGPQYDARINGIRYKSSTLFLDTINRYKLWLEQQDMKFKPLRFQGREVVSAEAIKNKFYSFDKGVTLANRNEMLRDWLLKELSLFGKSELDAPWVEEQIQILDIEDYQRAYQRMRRKEMSSEYDDEKVILSKMVVSERLKPLRKWVKSIRFVDVRKLYEQLFERPELFIQLQEDELPSDWSEICEYTLERIRSGELAYEDTTPYLYLKELTLGFRSNNTIRYVIIDEAQDYSPFQLFFIKRLFPRGRITALGDLNQAIYAHSSVLQQSSVLTELYGPQDTEQIILTQSYRSTREIVQFTREFIVGGEAIIPFNRSGSKPIVQQVEDNALLHAALVTQINALLEEGYETIAIICKTAGESAEAYEALHSSIPLKLIKKTTMSFDRGIHVIPAYLAKGVEFDAVMIYNGSAQVYAREVERKLFYTACTRAMHLLQVYSVGEISPFISAADPSTYTLLDN